MRIFWEDILKPAYFALGIILVILTICLPFLLHKPWAFLMAMFTAVIWAQILAMARTIQVQRAMEIRYGTMEIKERVSLVLGVVLIAFLVGWVVIYYVVV